jgi:hypothetical protein
MVLSSYRRHQNAGKEGRNEVPYRIGNKGVGLYVEVPMILSWRLGLLWAWLVYFC